MEVPGRLREGEVPGTEDDHRGSGGDHGQVGLPAGADGAVLHLHHRRQSSGACSGAFGTTGGDVCHVSNYKLSYNTLIEPQHQPVPPDIRLVGLLLPLLHVLGDSRAEYYPEKYPRSHPALTFTPFTGMKLLRQNTFMFY